MYVHRLVALEVARVRTPIEEKLQPPRAGTDLESSAISLLPPAPDASRGTCVPHWADWGPQKKELRAAVRSRRNGAFGCACSTSETENQPDAINEAHNVTYLNRMERSGCRATRRRVFEAVDSIGPSFRSCVDWNFSVRNPIKHSRRV